MEGRVGSLLTIVLSQRDEIQQLRKELASCHEPHSCAAPSILHTMVESAHSKGEFVFVQGQRLHEHGGTPTLPVNGQEDTEGFLGAPYAHGVIKYCGLQAHFKLLIDICKEMLVRSMTAALETFDLAPVRYSVCAAPVLSGVYLRLSLSLSLDWRYLQMHSSCCAEASCAAPAVTYASYSCASSLLCQCDYWWWSGDNLYNVYC